MAETARAVASATADLDYLAAMIRYYRRRVNVLAHRTPACWAEQAQSALEHLKLAADELEKAAALLRGETAMTLAGDEHEDVTGLPRLAQADATMEAVL